jgi:hypothetical protein
MLWLREKISKLFRAAGVHSLRGNFGMNSIEAKSTGRWSARFTKNKVALVLFLLGWNLFILGCASDDDDTPRQHHHRHRHGQDQSEGEDSRSNPSPSPAPY